METVVEKNVVVKDIETENDIKNILKGLDDVKNGRVMPIDDAMKKMFNEKKIWKSLV